ncbi:hypothetical protein [Parasulfitobacter algicola]|uniref:Uncharacterized protein n=1 Tax=Parasulfitobacter algicola TaxID=2614809 RepID=A0ABX2IN56_9RHOB|nr:hypothetical protein [Sulfitobacter algicola]NSX54303.1 hypothetical protein [Sulfitobacter algicola]
MSKDENGRKIINDGYQPNEDRGYKPNSPQTGYKPSVSEGDKSPPNSGSIVKPKK